MKKSNGKLTTFIDERYIPMRSKVKVAIVFLLVLIPVVIFYFTFYQPNAKKTHSLETQITSVQKKLREVKAKAANLARFEEELKVAQTEFYEKAALLPNEKEIPQLLKDISSLGRTAGLDFLTFKPLADVPKDFYSEIPISINVRGPYHNMGFFFDQVSKLERIVTVSNVKMSSPKKEAGEMVLKSDCRLVTYRFTDKPLPKPKKK
ncbi:MAG: type 4a pilus biogenesis protein PilO [Deltaproteobacteria bacterium]|nr:type 4a pilus biogenesis protein PilO [Deltaproteobacteria bacterium]MBW2659778.1 type 4a pilus biogenesis protein PilO [Deltaproteobacteria bacterium]